MQQLKNEEISGNFSNRGRDGGKQVKIYQIPLISYEFTNCDFSCRAKSLFALHFVICELVRYNFLNSSLFFMPSPPFLLPTLNPLMGRDFLGGINLTNVANRML